MKRFVLLTAITIILSCSSELINDESTTPTQYKLTIKASEGGTLSPDVNGIYNKGVVVAVRASPNEGYIFNRWEGTDREGCGWTLPPDCRATITMDSNRDVQAFFKKRLE